jgi:hypothetical protein
MLNVSTTFIFQESIDLLPWKTIIVRCFEHLQKCSCLEMSDKSRGLLNAMSRQLAVNNVHLLNATSRQLAVNNVHLLNAMSRQLAVNNAH